MTRFKRSSLIFVRYVLALLTAMVTPVSGAIAATLTVTTPLAEFVGHSVVRQVQLPNFDATLEDDLLFNSNFARFDESVYGTLTRVDIDLTYSISGRASSAIYLSNSYPATASLSVDVNEVVRLQGPAPSGFLYTSDSNTVAQITESCTATANSTAPTIDCLGQSDVLINDGFSISFDETGPYLGNFTQDNWLISVDLKSLLTATIDPDITEYGTSLRLDTLEDATYSVTYTYVPIPAAVWLFGSGLVGLALMVWRRKEGVLSVNGR